MLGAAAPRPCQGRLCLTADWRRLRGSSGGLAPEGTAWRGLASRPVPSRLMGVAGPTQELYRKLRDTFPKCSNPLKVTAFVQGPGDGLGPSVCGRHVNCALNIT